MSDKKDHINISELEELLADKARIEFELTVNSTPEIVKLNEIIDKKIEDIKNTIYNGSNLMVLSKIEEFVQMKRKVYESTYLKMKEELLANKGSCETCKHYIMFPNGERIIDDTIWCAKYPELNPVEDYELILKCQEEGYEPIYIDKRNEMKADTMLRLALLNNKLKKLKDGES